MGRFSYNDAGDSHDGHIRLLILVIILGFVLRVFACRYTYIINSDGAVYIHQARAVYYGLWSAVNSCTLKYLSIYPLLIAAVYHILGDWVISAKAVSVFFGALFLIPLYLLAKRFLGAKIGVLVTFVFALMPVFVTVSAYLSRDSIYWFFAMSGIFFFTGNPGKENYLGLFLSSIFFILATWTRVEAVLYLLVSCFWLLATGEEQKFKRLAVFLAPPAFLLFLFLAWQMLINPQGINCYHLKYISAKLMTSTDHYQQVREHLSALISHPPPGIPAGFFDNARTLFWFIALGTIIHNAMEAFFYPFFLIFILGLTGGTWKRIREEQSARYFTILAFSSVVLLYLYVFINWEMENRWLALLILPSFIFLGFGLEKIIIFLKSRFRLKESLALTLVVLAIMISTLPKNLSSRETDKLIFKEIGQSIARREGNSREIEILTLGNSARWISFYANMRFKGAPCPDKYRDYEKIVGNSYERFVQNLRSREIKYVVWEETQWPRQSFNPNKLLRSKDFLRLGAWSHPDTGRIILFKLL